MTRLRSTLAILVIAAASLAAVPPPAAPQPAPDPAARIHVESVEVNLSVHPAFQFVVGIPTVLRFETFEANGQRLLHIWAYSRVDSLNARITRVTEYLDAKPGIFTPLFNPPNRQPIMGYVDRAAFGEALQRALRDLRPERRLISKRLT
jgi:hypothetical protein